jgi:hypothetical protein
MKKLSIILLMLVSASMLYGQETRMTRKEAKAAQKAQLAEKTKALVNSGTWQFDATQMLPTSGRSRTLTSSYRVIVKDSEIDSYLPYFGRAYRAEYGSTDSPMSFKGEIQDLTVEDWEKGGWVISFKTENKNDRLEYTFHIGETGSATLMVNSTNRQQISYYGDLVEIEREKQGL